MQFSAPCGRAMSDLFKVAGPTGEPSASVLLVHGLGGHHYDTWRCSADKPWRADETFWPLWLAADRDTLAVYVVGYDAPVSRWRGTAMHLTDQARNILASLVAEPALARGPLLFIGHSLGGLVIKQLLRTADSMARYDARARNLIERVEKVAFLGTPHSGAGLASWGDRLRLIARPSAATASLVRNDPNLRDLNNWYRDWANDRRIAHLILTENKQTKILGMIVPPDSADPGLANVRSVPIDADHLGICKPTDRTTDVYVLVRDFVTRPVERPKPLSDEIVDKLLVALDARGVTALAEGARVERRTILELAKRLKPHEVLDFDQAVVELTAAVEIAVEVSEKGARPSNFGDLVDTVLAGIAVKTRTGDLEGAAREADQGFAEWERAEAERRAASVRSGIALLEAGLEQDILRRDASGAARRVQRIVALEHLDDASRFQVMRERQDAFYERGRDKGVNFDLLIAIEIARIALGSAKDALQRGATLNDLGEALRSLGERESGTARLEEAVTAYRDALKEYTRGRVPLDWAMTQNNLGNALCLLGERESGTARLEEGITAYRDALKERTRERVPLDWAMTQNNLGNALCSLGERESGTARLEEGITAYRDALKEWTRERVPLQWAMTQNNLGTALCSLGERESSTARLQEAVTAYRDALKEIARERVPLQWAATQNNLGDALRMLGERESGTARLEEAVTAYRDALKESTRERVPLQWATTQNNLGTALHRLGQRESGTARLDEAVTVYRAALEERTRERVPLDWAMTQNNLGTALRTLGERESGSARLEEAVTAYRDALKERTREQVPLDWAMTQNNLGNALCSLGERESGTARLEQAVTAYRDALKEMTREQVPLDWAMTTGNQGVAFMLLAERTEDPEMAKNAVSQIDLALAAVREGGHAPMAENYEAQLPKARSLVLRLSKPDR
jgi:tetratricopeptide (TPR) repeat protein